VNDELEFSHSDNIAVSTPYKHFVSAQTPTKL
jgi:hypothetical protein